MTIDSLDTKDECQKKHNLQMRISYLPDHEGSIMERVLEALKSAYPLVVNRASDIIKSLIIKKTSDLMNFLSGSIPGEKSLNLREISPLNFLRFGEKVSNKINHFCTDAKKVVATMDVPQDNMKNLNVYIDSIHNESIFLYTFLKRLLRKIDFSEYNRDFFEDLTLDEQKELSTRVGCGIDEAFKLSFDNATYGTAIEYLAAYEHQKKHWNTLRNNIQLLFSILSGYKKPL